VGVRDWKEWKLVEFLDEMSKGDLAALQVILDRASKLKRLKDLARALEEPDLDKWQETLKRLFV
jgi:hypothetical protein